jgi:hypothetical protein
MVPTPARRTSTARVWQAEAAAQAAQTAREAALLHPVPARPPALQTDDSRAGRPGRRRLLGAGAIRGRCGSHRGPDPARHPRPGHGPPGRRDRQIPYAIRMAAYNDAETAQAGHYTRVGAEAYVYVLVHEALTVSGDICPGPGQSLVRVDALTAPPAHPGPGLALRPAHCRRRLLSRHRLRRGRRVQIRSPKTLHKRSPYTGSSGHPQPAPAVGARRVRSMAGCLAVVQFASSARCRWR